MWNSGKSLLLVTGASRGLGRAFAEALASRLNDGSVVCLTARSESGLAATKARIEGGSDGRLEVVCAVQDLDLLDEASAAELVRLALSGREASDFQSAIIVHNAGTIGRCAAAARHPDPRDLSDYFRTNLVSAVVLNSAFLGAFEKVTSGSSVVRTTVVNVTSLAAVKPFKSWAKYCAGKAARDMFFKVLAAETEPDQGLKVLSFAPGPVDTDILSEVILDQGLDQDLRKYIADGKKESTLLQPHMSASKLLKVLDGDSFASGDHVDYFD